MDQPFLTLTRRSFLGRLGRASIAAAPLLIAPIPSKPWATTVKAASCVTVTDTVENPDILGRPLTPIDYIWPDGMAGALEFDPAASTVIARIIHGVTVQTNLAEARALPSNTVTVTR